MNMKPILTIALGLLSGPMVVSAATVTLVAEGSIVGGTTENFSSPVVGDPPPVVGPPPVLIFQSTPLSIFDGSATMTGDGSYAPSTFYIVKEGNWALDNAVQVQARPGNPLQFATIAGDGYVEIQFASGVSQFGGYFADIYSGSDTTFELFGVNQATSFWWDTFAFDSTLGNLIWAGLSSDTLIGRIRIYGNETAMDDLVFRAEASAPVPLPAAAWLLLSGLAGLGFVGRRRAAK